MARLSFRDGRFRVLQLSDIQERPAFDARTARSIDILLDRVRPDLVMLGGDNCFGPDIRTEKDLDAFLEKLAEPFESRGILWAHIFGNHDHDVKCVPLCEQQARYEAFPHNVSGRSNGPHGITDYHLDIAGRDGKTAFRIWALDTNGACAGGDLACRFLPGSLRDDSHGTGNYDILYFDQLVRFWNESIALEKECGKKIPGMLFTHIAPEEFITVRAHPEEYGLSGSAVEKIDPAVFNSGLFSMLLQRDEIRLIACGHTHMNSFSASYCGITCCFDACAGYTCYGIDEERGGRVFDIEEDTSAITTYMEHTFGEIRSGK